MIRQEKEQSKGRRFLTLPLSSLLELLKQNSSRETGLLSAADTLWIGQFGRLNRKRHVVRLSASSNTMSGSSTEAVWSFYSNDGRMSGACKAPNAAGFTWWHAWKGFILQMVCLRVSPRADAERSATRETSPRSPSSSSLSTRLCRWSCARSTRLSITRRLTCSKKSSWWTTTAMTVSATIFRVFRICRYVHHKSAVFALITFWWPEWHGSISGKDFFLLTLVWQLRGH